MADTEKEPQPRNIRIHNAAVSEGILQGRIHTIIRGELAPEFFDTVEIPPYQRELLTHHKHAELMDVLDPKNGIGIPEDLLLCVRTANFRVVGPSELIIPRTLLQLLDGHQRMGGAWARQALGQPVAPFGVKIFLDTTYDEEVAGFYQVNRLQTKVSPHVLFRNASETPATRALVDMLNKNPQLIQVQWSHMKSPSADVTVRMLYEITVILHGGGRPTTGEEILERLEEVGEQYGTEQMARNAKEFFLVLERCFGQTDKKDYMFRANLLRALARLFADHEDFWNRKNPNQLAVRAPEVKKLQGMRKRTVETGLHQSSSRAVNDLYDSLVRACNSNRPRNPLRLRQS